MCGIAGACNQNSTPVARADIEAMTEALSHRGPDGSGIYEGGPVALGHRRLAIIDLSSAGQQPMSNETGSILITYNGEIYNYRELRTELEAKGHQFRSRTDTEVAIHAYEEWGEECLQRFNGMFALAIWDEDRQELFLARDRYGIKPLYYVAQGETFLFASEVKGILAHPGYRADLDQESLVEYLTFQNFFTDRTLFAGIKTLPAGTWMRFRLDAKPRTHTQRYWDYDFSEPNSPASREEYIEELQRLFVQAVQRQLVSDVDVGSYLSGGIDSGSITSVASRQLPYMRTFTCGFDLRSASGLELAFDEREAAEYMSYLFKTEHYEMVLKAGDMERVMSRLVRHLEVPRVGQSYPNYYVAQLASRFVKVVLSGTAGDELFAGYPWRYYRAVVNDDFDHYIRKYYVYWQRLIPDATLQDVLRPIWKEVSHVNTEDIFRDVFTHHASELTRPEDYINHSLYFEAKTFLHGLLTVEDKLSMAHGLEARVPFLDNDLVDFAMRVPAHLKLGNLAEVTRLNENEPGPKTEKYFRKTKDGKLLLREVMQRHIPEQVTQRVKQGFSGPDGSWFRGESIEYVRKSLLNPQARIYEFMDRPVVEGLIAEHLSGAHNRRLLIWSLLNLEAWCAEFL